MKGRAIGRRGWLVPLLILVFLAFGMVHLVLERAHAAEGEKSESSGEAVDVSGKMQAARGELELLTDFSNDESIAFWFVVATFVALIGTISFSALFGSKKQVGVYRPYEQALLHHGKLELEDMLAYHSQYSWGNYAAVTIGMVLLSVTILAMDGDKLSDVERVIQVFGVICMTVAAIGLCWADLVHTNTQTPIIPVVRRFKLIDFSVQVGTMCTMVMLLAVLFFVCMISLAATIVCCVAYVVILIVVFKRRRVSKQEFFEYFNVRDAERWCERADPTSGRIFDRDRPFIDDPRIPGSRDYSGDQATYPPLRPDQETRKVYRRYLLKQRAGMIDDPMREELQVGLRIPEDIHRVESVWLERSLRSLSTLMKGMEDDPDRTEAVHSLTRALELDFDLVEKALGERSEDG